MTNKTMKTIGLTMAAGSAAMMIGSTMMGTSAKKSAKKFMKKAGDSISSVVDSLQDLM